MPVQVWHLGPGEFSPEMQWLISRFDVELVDTFGVHRQCPARRLGPWECKVYATLHSPFRHVVLLDADNVALIEPAELLHLPEYQRTGALFWLDNQSHLPDSPSEGRSAYPIGPNSRSKAVTTR